MNTIICSSKDIFELDIILSVIIWNHITWKLTLTLTIECQNWHYHIKHNSSFNLYNSPLEVFYYHSFKSKTLKLGERRNSFLLTRILRNLCKIYLLLWLRYLLEKNRNNFLGSGSRNTIYAIFFQTLRRNLRDSFNLSDLHPVTLKNCEPSPRKHVSKMKENLLQFL